MFCDFHDYKWSSSSFILFVVQFRVMLFRNANANETPSLTCQPFRKGIDGIEHCCGTQGRNLRNPEIVVLLVHGPLGIDFVRRCVWNILCLPTFWLRTVRNHETATIYFIVTIGNHVADFTGAAVCHFPTDKFLDRSFRDKCRGRFRSRKQTRICAFTLSLVIVMVCKVRYFKKKRCL
jgi:hypothetical protein